MDTVGFCTTTGQVEKVLELAKRAEKEELARSSRLLAGKTCVAAVCPHDDHLLAARYYLHVLPHLASAKTVVIFGVTHRAAREALGDPQKVILLDGYASWQAPGGPVLVDVGLRKYLQSNLPAGFLKEGGRGFAVEHSIEAMLPFLQHQNPKVRILPIMVTQADFKTMQEMADALAGVLNEFMSKNGLSLGRDITFVISNDATHYGPDFDYQPFGTDARAHRLAVEADRSLAERFLTGGVTAGKLESFSAEVEKEGTPWCGRYTVPFGLLVVARLSEKSGRRLNGLLLRQGDSYLTGTLPAYGIGLGTTAPFSLKHWVDYLSIAYVID
jgi:AmmeMemoRadiSam system protein B